MAEFHLDDEQAQIQDAMRKFASGELRGKARECDESASLPDSLFAQMWELGICAQSVPEQYGGFGLERSAVTGAIICEELAWGDVSLALAGMCPMLMMAPVLEFGTDAQKAEWLPKFCGDSYFHATAALNEPRISFDPFSFRTTITRANGKVRVEGAKCAVPLAAEAEAILVYGAEADGKVSAVIVDRAQAEIGARQMFMGLRPLPLYTVNFNCEVSAERLLGGDAGIDYHRLLALSRAAWSAMSVGVARASFEYGRDYAKERHAFGEPIASRQAIAFMLAEMAMEIDAMRLMAWRAAWRLDRREDATRDATLARRYCAEKSMTITDYGVQILGGHGYIREHPIEMWFRNGRGFASLEGMAIV